MSFVSIAVPIVSSKFVARNARFYLEKSGGSGDCSVVPRTNASRTGVRHGVFRITPTLVSFAMEDADEYERERQEQIRQNKALLESLGLNVRRQMWCRGIASRVSVLTMGCPCARSSDSRTPHGSVHRHHLV